MYLRHFPSFASGWYTTHIGNAAVILLNSNVGRLSSQEWQTQCTWYRRQLAELDRDTSVSVVIVGTHHPPFTNSTIIDPSEDVLCDFVPPYIASKKARLFISGHAHALEHFRQQGKDFLVIGGGAGCSIHCCKVPKNALTIFVHMNNASNHFIIWPAASLLTPSFSNLACWTRMENILQHRTGLLSPSDERCFFNHKKRRHEKNPFPPVDRRLHRFMDFGERVKISVARIETMAVVCVICDLFAIL